MNSIITTHESLVGKDPASVPLDSIDVSDPQLFQNAEHYALLKRLRQEDPVHFCSSSPYGPYWSVTKMKDVMAVEADPGTFTAAPYHIIGKPPEEMGAAFIAMDPPEHDALRMSVQPVVAPRNLQELEGVIRERAADILDGLPVGEAFNLVERVSIELTSRMLATLMGFPQERRYELIEFSEVITGSLDGHEHQGRAEYIQRWYKELVAIWNARLDQEPGFDLISLLQQSDATKNMIDDYSLFLSNIGLLIVGGNDTTRNSITGSVLALNEFPQEYEKLRQNPALISSMVPEIIRWQTPILHHRRTVTRDVEFQGKQIKKGDQVVMWWVSANRDETAIDNPDQFIIDRKNPRLHASFGFGVHRCMGNRLAEMQLRVLWEEILKRFRMIEVVGEPVRFCSNHFNGYSELPVKVHPW